MTTQLMLSSHGWNEIMQHAPVYIGQLRPLALTAVVNPRPYSMAHAEAVQDGRMARYESVAMVRPVLSDEIAMLWPR